MQIVPTAFSDACPRGPRVGANCRAPPCGYCPPFPEDAKGCALRAWRPPSVNGCPVAPPSEPVPVGFTNRRASSSPFTISGAIPTSGRSRRLRSTAIVSEWLWLAVCKIRSPLPESRVRASFPLPNPWHPPCPPWPAALPGTDRNGSSCPPGPHGPGRIAVAAFTARHRHPDYAPQRYFTRKRTGKRHTSGISVHFPGRHFCECASAVRRLSF